ncbi:hypothetical protein [Mesorhizobium sp. M4B.F.Ca.ET.089.01.1.1]|nr:hypothetical protein [Mesorhizobium sp. M4B.F.Ca.ET.089.01.1.1]
MTGHEPSSLAARCRGKPQGTESVIVLLGLMAGKGFAIRGGSSRQKA